MKLFNLEKKKRQIKNSKAHRHDDSSDMVPLTAQEYEDLMNEMLDMKGLIEEKEKLIGHQNKRIQQLSLDLSTSQEILKTKSSRIIITPKIERSLKYSISRLAMRITMAKTPQEVSEMIDHAVGQAGIFLQTFSKDRNLGDLEKSLFVETDINGVINVSEFNPRN